MGGSPISDYPGHGWTELVNNKEPLRTAVHGISRRGGHRPNSFVLCLFMSSNSNARSKKQEAENKINMKKCVVLIESLSLPLKAYYCSPL